MPPEVDAAPAAEGTSSQPRGLLVAIEGVDGAGKNTLTTALHEDLRACGRTVHRLGFPRYETPTGRLLGRALRGQAGDATTSTYGMAALFALDRLAARAEILAHIEAGEVVLLDRWVASSAAYSMARDHTTTTAGCSVAQWIADLEFGEHALPVPDLTVLLDVSADLAHDRATRRAADDARRNLDRYEQDGGLQRRTVEAYRTLAEAHWPGQRYAPAEAVMTSAGRGRWKRVDNATPAAMEASRAALRSAVDDLS